MSKAKGSFLHHVIRIFNKKVKVTSLSLNLRNLRNPMRTFRTIAYRTINLDKK